MKQSKAVERVQNKVAEQPPIQSLNDMIEKSVSQLRYALPKHMDAQRVARIALTCLRTNDKLMEAASKNPLSFVAALFQSAQLGLEPSTIGEAWLIPYRNKASNGSYQPAVQFQIGAYGWVKLFYNHQNSLSIQMDVVHERDHFEYDLGKQEVSHVPPKFGTNRGDVVGYYACAKMTNGGALLKVMSKDEAREWGAKHSKCWDKICCFQF